MDKWIKKDFKYIWHPYTQMKDCEEFPPILIDRAKGIKLYDNKGNFYYDTISSWWCNIHGHNHPHINNAIKKQLKSFEHVLFAGFTHKPAIEIAEALINITPKNLSKVFFSDNGSTAVETALKISFQYWYNNSQKKKKRFISFDAGYHGDTIGTMSLGGVDLFHKMFSPLFFKSFKVPTPYCYRCPVGRERSKCSIDCIKPLESLLKQKHTEIAALIMEPLVLAAGGMIIYPKEYLKIAANLTKKYNVHLILDEVATGFGRTGKMFAAEHAKVEPDFICLSKGITSGYLPFAATLTTDNIYNAFYDDHSKKKTFYHGHTYTANPISCSAAIASLEIFKREDVLKNVALKAKLLHKKLKEFRELRYVGDVRSIGMIGAVELVKDKKSKIPFAFKERLGQKIYQQGLKENLVLRPLGNVIYFFLPLSTKATELETILERSKSIIQKVVF